MLIVLLVAFAMPGAKIAIASIATGSAIMRLDMWAPPFELVKSLSERCTAQATLEIALLPPSISLPCTSHSVRSLAVGKLRSHPTGSVRRCHPAAMKFSLPSKRPGKAVLASLLGPQFGVSSYADPRGEDATRAGVHGLDRAPM